MKKQEAQKLSDKVISALKKKREELKISRYQISKKTGISQSTLSNIKNLKQKPTFYTLIMIAEYLDIKLSVILNEADDI